MEEKKQVFTEEIGLGDIFMTLWKQKLMILSITLILTILSGIFSIFILSPVYHSNLLININLPETYKTKYGDYTLKMTYNEQYIAYIKNNVVLKNTIKDMGYEENRITIDNLKSRINIQSTNVNQNSFIVTISSDNPIEAQKLAQSLFDNYIEYLDAITIQDMVNYFSNYYTVELSVQEDQLELINEMRIKNEKMLKETPKTIDQVDASNHLQKNKNTDGIIVVENIINENYTKIENDIIENKQTANNIENTITKYNQYLEELKIVKENLDNYKKSNYVTKINSITLSYIMSYINLTSEPIAPNHKTSPSNAKNIVLGFIGGGVVAVFIAFVKEYWYKKE